MKDCVEIVVDGQTLTVDRKVILLQGLKEFGFEIPSLCFYPSLGGYGSCGLCSRNLY